MAEKFHCPIVTFIDTPGAYPGIGAEERGQAEAIARTIQVLSRVRAPIIAVIIGIPVLAIATDRSDRSMPRKGWWQWVGAYAAFFVVFLLVNLRTYWRIEPISLEEVFERTVWGMRAIIFFIVPWFMARRCLWRVRDAGWNTKVAYLFAVPFINFILWLPLLFVPTSTSRQEEARDQ